MSFPKVKFYLDYMSQPCRALAIFMKMNGWTFEEQIVSFVTGDTRSEWYGRINPMQRVPCMVEGDFRLTESMAILRYLASYSTQENWYPKDTRQRALVDEYSAWQHTGVRPNGAKVFITQALIPHRTGKPVDTKALEDNCAAFEKILDQMENYFLTRGDFLAGAEMTLADLSAICELMQPVCVGYPITKGRPLLEKWIERVKAKLQPHFDETHKEIFAFGAKYFKKDF